MHESNSKDPRSGNSFHLDDDLCIDLLNGLLEEEQCRIILNHIRRCPSCEEFFQASVANFEATRAVGEPSVGPDGRWALEAQKGIPDEKAPVPEKLKAPWAGFLKRLSPARAALVFGMTFIIAAALIILSINLKQGEQALEYWIPAERSIRKLRSDVPGADMRLWDGIRAYNTHDLESAIKSLGASRAKGTYNSLRNIYLASALSLSGRYTEASQILSALDPTGLPEPWRSEVKWIHYIVLSRTGGDAEAMKILEELCKLETPIGTLARERKKELEDK